MKIENVTKQKKYTKSEGIPVNCFFYDEVEYILYYVEISHGNCALFSLMENGVNLENLSSNYSVEDIITETLDDTSKLRLINSDDVKITYKFRD